MTTPGSNRVRTVSVVIPCLNDASMLATCLAALAAQTTPVFEVIVVDGGSTDDSRDVARAAGARVITALGGIPDASATGLDACHGEIIARLDADSRPAPDWLQRIGDDFGSEGHWSVVTGTGEFYGTGPLLAWAGRVLYLGGYFHVVGALLGHPPLFGSNVAILRDEWSRLSAHVHRGRMDIHDDLDLSIQLAPDMTVLFDPALHVGVSGRQLASWSSLRRHVAWSANTFALNRQELPQRTRRRLRRRYRGVTNGPVPHGSSPSEWSDTPITTTRGSTMTTTTSRTDDDIRHAVEDELHWVPGIDADSIGVGVRDGVVSLSGQVPHLWLRHDAGAAALRIRGVRGLANEVEIVLAGDAPTDADIAGAIAHRLLWTDSLPEGAVAPEVHDGTVTLTGTVEFESQRRAIEHETRRVRGVRWITNNIALTARASAKDTKDRIAAALTRNATIDAGRITVTADGTEVTLSGQVGSWDEKHQAEMTAWSSPHITAVHNQLVVAAR